MRRFQGRRARRLTGIILATASLTACGMKGPPLAPVRVVATPISDLTARRLGSTVYLQFRVPVRNVIGDGPADIERVEVYAYTGRPVDGLGTPLDDRTFLESATLVASAEVRPPPPPVEESDGSAPRAEPLVDPDDDRPAQGQVLTFVDHLTPASYEPVVPKRRRRAPVVATPIMPAFWPTPEPSLPRYYVAVARNRRNQASAATTKVLVTLDPPPPPPTMVVAQYNETAIMLSWLEAEGSPRPIQPPAVAAVAVPGAAVSGPGRLTATPLVPQRSPYTYNVYDPNSMPNIDGIVAPINPTPLAVLTFSDTRLAFGSELCYAVHTVETSGTVTAESEASATLCVTPEDTFRPSPPTRLVAVGSAGAISLLWEASPEDDVAGYVVLRGEGPDAALEPITASPVRESTYRDTTATPGVRYTYAVVAVDSQTPPNVSLESNRVEESSR